MNVAEREAMLLQRVQSGDVSASFLLMDLVWTTIQHCVCRRIPDSARSIIDLDDIFSETRFAVWEGLPRFVPRGPNAIRRFVTTIALCRLRDMLRKLRPEYRRVSLRDAPEPPDHDDALSSLASGVLAKQRTPSGLAARKEAIDILRAALKEMPPMEQEVLKLHDLEKLSFREAARQMHLPETNVRRLHDKAMIGLSKKLGHWSKYLSTTT